MMASKGNVKNGEYTAKILSLTILALFFLDFLLFLHIFSAMKRYRTVDVPPKFRRTVKGRSTRLGESVYFNRFFSAYNLVYLKFFMMWIGCITLDFLIGFRFELLWPVWLLFRHLYESFRVHAFSSSLHYSAFSVFFVCVTATSDLVCYLFIPIQVLIFLASTYVWVQFVYQSSDRGICLPSLFLWALFIVFEYSVRYRFDNATWYLARTSWITAGLFPSTADSVSVGSPSSTPSASSTRLELYRPFAAHCIGFPVVTLGFRVKSFFSNWRMRIRREEVRRQNEFYERILAEAIPTSFENRKHFISSRSHLSIEQQEAIDYDSGGYATSELLLNGMDPNGNSRLYAANQSALAAICAPNNNNTTFQPSSTYCPSSNPPLNSTHQQCPNSSSTSSNPMALFKKQQTQQRFTKQTTPTTSLKQQNGISTTKKNGSVLGGRGGGSSGIYSQQSSGNLFTTHHKSGAKVPATTGRHNHQQQNGGSALHHHHGNNTGGPNGVLLQQSRAGGADESIVQKVWRTFFRFCCLFVLSTIGQLVTALWPSFQQTLESLISQFRGISSAQDDLISTSGDGSNMADEDDWDERESNHHYQAGNTELQAILQNGKRRSRRPRGLTQTSATFAEQSSQLKTTTAASSSSSLCAGNQQHLRNETTTSLNGGVDISAIEVPPTPSTESSYESSEQIRENALKLGELKHLQKEKQTLEQSVEKLKGELKLSRQSETELRQQLQFAQQQEQNCRNEWKQQERDQKAKIEQLESKCRQMAKQHEHFKANIQALEKRVGELQLKKLEIERELANERLTKQHTADQQQASKNMQESGEQFKQKLMNMDRELKQLKREMKAKDEQCTKWEDEVRQLRSMSTDDGQLMETLKQKNFVLEQTLSAENRLKQDLFRALNDSKAEIASMKAELRINKSKEQAEMMNAFSASNSLFHNTTGGGSSSTGSSPTQQHPAQQFSTTITHQQKSLTPPPLSMASSPINLEQLLQATQNMSYSLGPIEMNGGTTTNKNENSYANMSTYGNGTAISSSSPYVGGEASEMLAVGGHRAAVGSNFAGIGKNTNTGGGGN